MTTKREYTPTRATGRTCPSCGNVFTTALDKRKQCPACKAINGEELKQLMGYDYKERWGVRV